MIKASYLIVPVNPDGRNAKRKRNDARMQSAGNHRVVFADLSHKLLRRIHIKYGFFRSYTAVTDQMIQERLIRAVPACKQLIFISALLQLLYHLHPQL